MWHRVQQCLQDCNVVLDGGDYREADVTITGNQTPSCAMGCFLFQVTVNRHEATPDVATDHFENYVEIILRLFRCYDDAT